MAVPINTPVPTYSGWKLARDLTTDDILFTQDSKLAAIKRLQTYTATECYEIEFDDGLSFVCDKHTKMQLQTRYQRENVRKAEKRTDRKHKFGARCTYKVYGITDILHTYIRPDKRFEFSLLNAQAVPFPTKDLPVPPYLFAIWISIKTKNNNLWVNNIPIEKIKRIARGYGYHISVRKPSDGRSRFDIRPTVRDSFLFAGADIPSTIPISYIEASIEQRQELVEGLIDSQRVWYDKKSSSHVLQDKDFKYLKRLQGLLESLGYKTRLVRYKSATNYKLSFKIYDNPRKNRRLITKITAAPPQECVHIETGTQFLVGEGFICIS